MENEDEYWAEGCQSWFDATVRCDVNDGVNSREKLAQHDPGLAQALQAAFGDNPWRYPHTAPGPLRDRSGRAVQHSSVPAGRLVGGQGHMALEMEVEVAAPGAAGMTRSAAGAVRRQGCVPGPARCTAGCWSGPTQLWASCWGRSHRGAALAKGL